jgi:heme exporter protein D
MDLGPHAGFIVAAYALAIVVVTALIAWVGLDHRAQARALAELEARGTVRRSARVGFSAKVDSGLTSGNATNPGP